MAHPSNVIPPPPSSILIIGAGVFGLSTLHALLTSPRYKRTKLVLVDPYLPSLSNDATDGEGGGEGGGEGDGGGNGKWQNPHAASIDSSRIIRADYANPAYTALAAEAQGGWRAGFPYIKESKNGKGWDGDGDGDGQQRTRKKKAVKFEDYRFLGHEKGGGDSGGQSKSTQRKRPVKFEGYRYVGQGGDGERREGGGSEQSCVIEVDGKAVMNPDCLTATKHTETKEETIDPQMLLQLANDPTFPKVPYRCGKTFSRNKMWGWQRPYNRRRVLREMKMATEKIESQVYHESGILVTSTSSGSSYVDNARLNCEKVLGIPTTHVQGEEAIREAAGLPSAEAANADNRNHKEDSAVGDLGYLNPVSGWADASAAMAGMMASCVELARERNTAHHSSTSPEDRIGEVIFKRAKASKLLFSPCTPPTSSSSTPSSKPKCTGATLSTAETVHADISLLAAGAWSGSLLDLTGRAEASGQVVAYAPLTDSEAGSLKTMRVLLNLGSGLFCIPPTRQSISNEGGEGGWELKVARHGHGYANPTTVTVPSFTSHNSERRAGEIKEVEVTPSLPSLRFTPIPPEGDLACRHFLQGLFGPEIGNRPWNSTRICWYADTPTGDFLIDWVPDVDGLVVATGGSGHAFKFAPVLGGKVLGRLEGRLNGEVGRLWRWRDKVGKERWKGDGSRGGGRGLRLWEEW